MSIVCHGESLPLMWQESDACRRNNRVVIKGGCDNNKLSGACSPVTDERLTMLPRNFTEEQQMFRAAYRKFLEKEIQIRKINNLPPFQRFISLILTGDNKNELEKEALKFKLFLENKINGKILGPVSAPIFRLKRKYRIRLLIRGLKTLKLQNSLAKLIPKYKFTSGIKLSVDVDPISFN